MTSISPCVAVALVRRFIPDSEALAGDLIEEFGVRRSHLWLWRQVIVALALEVMRPAAAEIRPLRLVDREPRVLAAPPHQRPVNLSASPIPDIGGLGIVALAALVTVVQPMIWWAAGASVFVGLVLGALMVAARAREADSRPTNVTPAMLLPRG